LTPRGQIRLKKRRTGADVDYAMPWLPFFVAEDDLPVLIDRFNQDEEIAYVVKDAPDRPGAQRWRAVRSVETLAMGEHVLWHVPTGPLPMLDLSEPLRNRRS
jgi:hypothetical protein